MKIPKYVIAPKGCRSYLTPWKMYEVNPISNTAFYVKNDNGRVVYALFNVCNHLNGGDWIIPDGDADDEPKTTKPRVTAVRVGDITLDCDDNPNEIYVYDEHDCIVVPCANIPALIEALKMMVAE